MRTVNRIAPTLLAACFVASAAHADPYVIFGAGTSRLETSPINGLWYQNGFDHVSEEKSNTWRIGAGYRFSPYLSAEVDYRSLGNYSAVALFVGDVQGVAGHYNTGTSSCNGPCEKSTFGYQHGKTDGIGLSLLVSPGWKIDPFIRLGGFVHRSSFESVQPLSETELTRHRNDSTAKFHDTGLRAMYGAGVSAGAFQLEYTRYPDAGGIVSPYRNISTVTLSIRLDL